MNIETEHSAYAQAPALVEEYERTSAALEAAKRAVTEAERDHSAAKRKLAATLIPKDSRDGVAYRLWLPRGLLELIARPTWSDGCEARWIRWIVRDKSRAA